MTQFAWFFLGLGVGSLIFGFIGVLLCYEMNHQKKLKSIYWQLIQEHKRDADYFRMLVKEYKEFIRNNIKRY